MSILWFDAGLAPPAPDIYLVRVPHIPSGEAYALWDGARWLCWGSSPERPEMARIGGPDEGYDWRPIEWLQIT